MKLYRFMLHPRVVKATDGKARTRAGPTNESFRRTLTRTKRAEALEDLMSCPHETYALRGFLAEHC